MTLPMRLKRLIDSPRANLVVGILLLITSLFEFVETGLERFVGFDITATYGVMFLAVQQILRSVVSLLEGLAKVHKPGTHEPEG